MGSGRVPGGWKTQYRGATRTRTPWRSRVKRLTEDGDAPDACQRQSAGVVSSLPRPSGQLPRGVGLGQHNCATQLRSSICGGARMGARLLTDGGKAQRGMRPLGSAGQGGVPRSATWAAACGRLHAGPLHVALTTPLPPALEFGGSSCVTDDTEPAPVGPLACLSWRSGDRPSSKDAVVVWKQGMGGVVWAGGTAHVLIDNPVQATEWAGWSGATNGTIGKPRARPLLALPPTPASAAGITPLPPLIGGPAGLQAADLV